MLKQPSATASAIGKNILRRSQGKESAPIIAAGPYYSLGRACLLLGRLDEALSIGRLCDRSLPAASGYSAHATHLLGDIATHPDRFDADSGEAHYRQAVALAEPRGMRPLAAHCHLGLGTLYRRTGKREQTQEHLITATTMYREMDMRFWLEKAEAVTIAPAGGA
jgi:tetratricopeptide (TPR) repeat protein